LLRNSLNHEKPVAYYHGSSFWHSGYQVLERLGVWSLGVLTHETMKCEDPKDQGRSQLRHCYFLVFQRSKIKEDKESGRIHSQESQNPENPEIYVGSEHREECQGKRVCAHILLKACAKEEKGDLWICSKGSRKSSKELIWIRRRMIQRSGDQ
jgi:hypothetical protein